MDAPITFEATARDLANLAIIEATGLTRDEAIRAALAAMAVESVPVVRALRQHAA
jgi:hypothetical protein